MIFVDALEQNNVSYINVYFSDFDNWLNHQRSMCKNSWGNTFSL